MRYGLLAVVLIGAVTLGGCTEGVFDPKGPIALAERRSSTKRPGAGGRRTGTGQDDCAIVHVRLAGRRRRLARDEQLFDLGGADGRRNWRQNRARVERSGGIFTR